MKISGNAKVLENATVTGAATVRGNATVRENATVSGNAYVTGNAVVTKDCDYSISFDQSIPHTIYREGYGNENRFVTHCPLLDIVCAGCFSGTLKEFIEAVDKKYDGKGNYYALIEIIKQV